MFTLLRLGPQLAVDVAPTPRVSHRALEVVGGLDRAIVDRVIRHNHPSLRACQRQAQRRDGALPKGALRVRWFLGGKRRPSAVGIEDSGPRSEALRRCVVEAVKQWEHPDPRCTAQISATFVFTSE
ncbi:MAG: AgmX/PglI C-terminal domain-containing protein [Myxococcales bacterium]|nr:AgmX/PglI C-terminal domain-containing protein [Myxococcales bacterium]